MKQKYLKNTKIRRKQQMSKIIPFNKSGGMSTNGSGPEDPMLERRVEKLEEKIDRIETILVRLEPMIIELKSTTAKQPELNTVRVEIAEIKGRITNLPSTWTLISFSISSCLASAGFAFAVARFFKP
jgi:hypothetical protein